MTEKGIKDSKHTEPPEQIQRLIDWNADVLLKLLKQIVTKREIAGKAGWDDEPELETKETIFDEVVEVINLPGFDGYTGNKSLDVDPQVVQQLKEFVAAIGSAYRSNAFHCLRHASHVTMAVTKLISRIEVSDFDATNQETDDDPEVTELIATHLHKYTYGITSDPLAQFAVVLSALIHAVDHRGISNEDLAKEEPDVVARYKGKSITEQRSLDKAWKKLMEPQFENLRRCIYADKAEKQRFRQVVVNSVLATDIDDEELQALRMSRWKKTFGSNSVDYSEESINRKATIVIECLMQSSDVFHTMQHWHIYLKWTERSFVEANIAFKADRSKENPVLKSWYKGELTFFDNYVIPLAVQLKDIDAFVVRSDEYLINALENRKLWAKTGKDIVAAFNANYNGATDAANAAKIDLAKAMVDDGTQKASTPLDGELPKHLQRLVDWNVEVLQRLLKQILAKRAAAAGKSGQTETAEFHKKLEGQIVVDEVVESISFPEFDPSTSAGKLDANSVELNLAAAAQLREYVTKIGHQFANHPFHCLDHGSQVSMTANKLLSRIVSPASSGFSNDASELHKQTFGLASDPLTQFAVVFAALIHDIDHTGVPNAQLVRENHELAARYKHRSIAEQHSIDLAWSMLMQPGFGDLTASIFADATELLRFRQIIVNSVMATDCIDKKLDALRGARWEKAFGEGKGNTSKEDVDRKATSVIATLMQTADSFHALGHWHLYSKWNERHFLEMYGAFEKGRLSQDPSVYWYKSEIMFLEQHVIPLCQKMQETGVFGASAEEALAFAISNRDQWSAKGGNMVASMMAKYYGKAIEKARADKILQRKSLSASKA